MRSSFAAAMMGIGGISVAFATVVFVIEIFASRSDPLHKVPTMTALAVGCLMGGAILFGLGFLLNRFGRRTGGGALSGTR
jgi:hypothetical protein